MNAIDEKAAENGTPPQTLNPGTSFPTVASTNPPPQMSTLSNNCGPSGSRPQQRPAAASANAARPGRPIKQEMLAPDSDDDVLVTFDLAAAPYVVEPHGAGFRLYIRDMKDLAQEDTNFLLAILGPPEHAPAADADRQMKFHPLNTGGKRIDVADTGLLTVAQLASLRRVISGITDYVVGGEAQNRENAPIQAPRDANGAEGDRKRAKRGRLPKDPKAPKRARAAYTFFVQDYCARNAVKPQATFKATASEWKTLAEHERTPFRQMAAVDKARYAAARALYLNGA
ncbi:nucleosome binding protein (Nhp6a) [Aphelenchoides avenae]|nr:nucleosome binding protein (Nhp6a) [Aphelenchus avenae]